jgi:hypothetical protein
MVRHDPAPGVLTAAVAGEDVLAEGSGQPTCDDVGGRSVPAFRWSLAAHG